MDSFAANIDTMKHFRTLILALAALTAATACADLLQPQAQGEIRVSFDSSIKSLTKSQPDIPSPDDFFLTVTDSGGKTIYDGLFGSSPETIMVKAGSYTVSAVSRKFSEPLYDAPQYGDTQVVSVVSGQSVCVQLTCTQLNCGVKLNLDEYFRTAYPNGVLYLKGTGGSLMYGYSEKRTAYFQPGGLILTIFNQGSESTLCTRTIEARQMLTLGLSATLDESRTAGGIRLQVDTSRTWTADNIISGGGDGGSSDAYNVSDARSHIGEDGVWVEGYAVGVATNTGKFSFTPPFSKNTNIVLGLRSTSVDSQYLLSVELPKGDMRDALNLVDNPSLQGRKLKLKGSLVDAYYGIPGLKNVSAYEY